MNKVESLKKAWWRMPSSVRKPLILMVGIAIIVAGIVMLVFPGPGWAAIFLGFAVLATEFAFAVKVRDWMVEFFRNLMKWLKNHWKSFRS